MCVEGLVEPLEPLGGEHLVAVGDHLRALRELVADLLPDARGQGLEHGLAIFGVVEEVRSLLLWRLVAQGDQRVLVCEGAVDVDVSGVGGDRKRFVSGKSVYVRVDLGGRLTLKKNKIKDT